MYRINLCLSCDDYDSFEITIGTDSKKANLQFIRLLDNHNERKRLLSEFNKLDSHFFTHVSSPLISGNEFPSILYLRETPQSPLLFLPVF